MAKLTLNVDGHVVSRAKKFAKRQGISVSEMVETYLAAVDEPVARPTRATPILRSIRGILKNADMSQYRKYLETKYK